MKTVEQHLEHAETLQEHIKSADALVLRLRKELQLCRSSLEWAMGFSHPAFSITANYYMDAPVKNGEQCTLKQMADHRIAAINALLGDKA